MISDRNPIHRLREIEQRESELVMLLAPAYLAVDLLGHERENAANVDVTIIECHPKFAPLWQEITKLRDEKLKIHMNLSLAWEKCPIEVW